MKSREKILEACREYLLSPGDSRRSEEQLADFVALEATEAWDAAVDAAAKETHLPAPWRGVVDFSIPDGLRYYQNGRDHACIACADKIWALRIGPRKKSKEVT